jgi:hypothetical protein
VNADLTLSSLLDTLIPPSEERGLPGAGALGLGPKLRRDVPEIVPLIDAGLEALDAAARDGGAADFGSLAPEVRARHLDSIAGEHPALVPAILFHLYRAYYAEPAVLSGLGMPGRPPWPEGYEMEPDDFGLLDAVRARERFYRET